MVDDGRRGDSLSSSRRTLDQTQRPLQYRLHSVNLPEILKAISGFSSGNSCTEKKIKYDENVVHSDMAFIEIALTDIKCLQTDKHPQTARSDLGVIEVWQALSGEALWQLALDGDVLHLVTQQLVVNVT